MASFVSSNFRKKKNEVNMMNSPLSINEFRERLELNTKIGDPKIKGSPLAIFTIFGQNKKNILW